MLLRSHQPPWVLTTVLLIRGIGAVGDAIAVLAGRDASPIGALEAVALFF